VIIGFGTGVLFGVRVIHLCLYITTSSCRRFRQRCIHGEQGCHIPAPRILGLVDLRRQLCPFWSSHHSHLVGLRSLLLHHGEDLALIVLQ
jgi:hypothetical protein